MKKTNKFQWGKWLLWLAIGSLLCFGSFIKEDSVTSKISISIKPPSSHFLSKKKVLEVIEEIKLTRPQIFNDKEVDLKSLERNLDQISFVKKANVSKDIEGHLKVVIDQEIPLARVIASTDMQKYICRNGTLINLSKEFTARVPLITGKGTEKIFEKNYFKRKKGRMLLDFLHHIENTPRWKAQFAQITIDEKHNMTIYPQVGKEKIEMGKPNDFLKKLDKLEKYYKKIIPTKGWGTYSNVKLQYKGQIVCE